MMIRAAECYNLPTKGNDQFTVRFCLHNSFGRGDGNHLAYQTLTHNPTNHGNALKSFWWNFHPQ